MCVRVCVCVQVFHNSSEYQFLFFQMARSICVTSILCTIWENRLNSMNGFYSFCVSEISNLKYVCMWVRDFLFVIKCKVYNVLIIESVKLNGWFT